jgi:hypothetical protein
MNEAGVVLLFSNVMKEWAFIQYPRIVPDTIVICPHRVHLVISHIDQAGSIISDSPMGTHPTIPILSFSRMISVYDYKSPVQAAWSVQQRQ